VCINPGLTARSYLLDACAPCRSPDRIDIAVSHHQPRCPADRQCAQCATKGAECTSTYIKSLQDKTVKKRKLDDRPKDSSRDASARAGARAGEREGSALISNSARAGPAALPRARTESVRIEGSGAGAEQFGSASASASPGPGREGSRIAASGGRLVYLLANCSILKSLQV
jgi:hypothetical protein